MNLISSCLKNKILQKKCFIAGFSVKIVQITVENSKKDKNSPENIQNENDTDLKN